MWEAFRSCGSRGWSLTMSDSFIYVLKSKNKDWLYRTLNEADYMCVYREPVEELIFKDVHSVLERIFTVALGPDWYKRGLAPLKSCDIIWYDGIGYLLLPLTSSDPPLWIRNKCTLSDIVKIGSRHLVRVTNVNPRKVLACTE